MQEYRYYAPKMLLNVRFVNQMVYQQSTESNRKYPQMVYRNKYRLIKGLLKDKHTLDKKNTLKKAINRIKGLDSYHSPWFVLVQEPRYYRY